MRIGPETAASVAGDKKVGLRRWRWIALGAAVAIVVIAGAVAIWNPSPPEGGFRTRDRSGSGPGAAGFRRRDLWI